MMFNYYIAVTEPNRTRATGRLSNEGIALNKIHAVYWPTREKAQDICDKYQKINPDYKFEVRKQWP